MDTTTSLIGSVSVGSPVDIATYTEAEARLLKGMIVSAEPLQIRVGPTVDAEPYRDRTVTLLTTLDGSMVRGEGRIVGFEGGVLTFADASWQPLDRRGYPRFAFQARASLRVVIEGEAQLRIQRVDAEILDLSANGVYVIGGVFPPKGTLVEFQTDLGAREISCLGVVARVTEHGAGIHFVEYLGNARSLIEATLAAAA